MTLAFRKKLSWSNFFATSHLISGTSRSVKYYDLARIMGQKPLLGDMTSFTKEICPKKHRGILTTSTVFLFEAFWSINGNNGLQLVKIMGI